MELSLGGVCRGKRRRRTNRPRGVAAHFSPDKETQMKIRAIAAALAAMALACASGASAQSMMHGKMMMHDKMMHGKMMH